MQFFQVFVIFTNFKVCIQYLVPFLSGLTHDATLLRPPPQEGDGDNMMGENKENIAEPVTPEVSI